MTLHVDMLCSNISDQVSKPGDESCIYVKNQSMIIQRFPQAILEVNYRKRNVVIFQWNIYTEMLQIFQKSKQTKKKSRFNYCFSLAQC